MSIRKHIPLNATFTLNNIEIKLKNTCLKKEFHMKKIHILYKVGEGEVTLRNDVKLLHVQISSQNVRLKRNS